MEATIIYRNGTVTEPVYETVAKVKVSDTVPFPVTLEMLFERFNVGDRGGKRIRSLSVGDLVELHTELNTHLYRCESVGWRQLR